MSRLMALLAGRRRRRLPDRLRQRRRVPAVARIGAGARDLREGCAGRESRPAREAAAGRQRTPGRKRRRRRRAARVLDGEGRPRVPLRRARGAADVRSRGWRDRRPPRLVCIGITILCGMLPWFEIRHDDPAAVLRREAAGPSGANASPARRARRRADDLLLCARGVDRAALRELSRGTANRRRRGARANRSLRRWSRSGATARSRARVLSDRRANRRCHCPVVVGELGQCRAGRTRALGVGSHRASGSAMRDQTLDVVTFRPATLEDVVLPPLAGSDVRARLTPRSPARS